MTSTLVIGILVAFVSVTVAAGRRRAPTRALCPDCGERTELVLLPPILQKAAGDLRGRWCPGCAWEGLGRQGPELTPGRPIAHDSGFRWGVDRMPENFGFRFAEDVVEEADPVNPSEADVPHHPSGFRFAGGPDAPPPPPPAPAPRGFRWRDPERSRVPSFRWKD